MKIVKEREGVVIRDPVLKNLDELQKNLGVILHYVPNNTFGRDSVVYVYDEDSCFAGILFWGKLSTVQELRKQILALNVWEKDAA